MYRIIFILLVLITVSCGTQRQIQKSYLGKSEAILLENFGTPKTVFDKDQEKMYVFEIVKKLESTEVSQGKLALDPMITPGVNKTERYFFTVKNGVVIKAKFEKEYER